MCARPRQPPAGRAKRDDVRYRDGRDLSPQLLHLIAVQARRALDELRGIDQVRRTALVDEDLQARILANQRTRRTGVIEMHMCQQDMGHVAQTQPLRVEAELERIEA